VARKNPVSEPDKAIGRRLMAFRKELRLTRVALARELGVDSTTFANYEYGRVPAPYWVAKKLADGFGLNLIWLAEGNGPMKHYLPIPEVVDSALPLRGSFSEVYTTKLKGIFEALEHFETVSARLAANIDSQAPVGMTRQEQLLWLIRSHAEKTLSTLSPAHQVEFLLDVLRSIETFARKKKLKT
jgi:DNA-binding XRE family transcriptional regulator